MLTDIGDFEFNWIGLVQGDDLVMFAYVPLTQKVKTQGATSGNTLTRNLVIEHLGIANATPVVVSAESWMYDYSAELDALTLRIVNVEDALPNYAVKTTVYTKTESDARYAAASHNHSASNITSGTLSKDRLPNASINAKGASQLSNSYTGTSQTKATTEKALNDGLYTKLGNRGSNNSYVPEGNDIASAGGMGGFSVTQNGAGDAALTFHIAGVKAGNFGIDRTTGKWSVGGWSFGTSSYAIFHEGNRQKNVRHFYSSGDVTVDFNTGHDVYIVTRWQIATGTITLQGTLRSGVKLIINNVHRIAGKATITGKTMFLPNDTSANTQTFTGGGQAEFTAFNNNTGLMLTKITGVK